MPDQPSYRKIKVGSESRAIRVLYVDDASVIRDTVARLLEMNGYQVYFATNGKEGVAKAQRLKPDIILMDLRMPVMDGFEAINQIKVDPQTRGIPIFVLSAWSSQKERERAHLAGADAFFVKPPNLDRLMQAIDDYAGGKVQ